MKSVTIHTDLHKTVLFLLLRVGLLSDKVVITERESANNRTRIKDPRKVEDIPAETVNVSMTHQVHTLHLNLLVMLSAHSATLIRQLCKLSEVYINHSFCANNSVKRGVRWRSG